MDTVIDKILTTGGPLGVLVVVVWLFLKAQKDNRDSAIQERKEFMDKIHDLHGEHISARAESRVVLDRVATSLHEISIAVATCPLKKAQP